MQNLPKTLMGFLLKYGFKPYALILSVWIFSWVCAGLLNGVFTPLVQKWFIALFEQSVPAGMTFIKFATPTILFIIGGMLLQSIVNILRNVIYSHWTPQVKNNLSQTLIDYVNSQSMGFFTKRMPGKIDSQVNYITGGFFIIEDFVRLFVFVGIVSLNMGLIMGINKWVALALGGSFLIRLAYSWILIKPMNRASKKVSEASSSLAGKVIDGISNFSIVKLFAGTKYEKSYLAPARQKWEKDRKYVSFVQRLFWGPGAFLWDILFGLTLFLCAYMYMVGKMQVSDIVFTIAVYTMVSDYIEGIVEKIPSLVDVIGSAQQSYKELIKPIEIQDAPDAPELKVAKGGIEVKNVTFKYGKKKVLDDLSLSIKPGEKVGLVGPSGAGKTTLVNLLMRFYDPAHGIISFDDQDIKTVTQNSLRSNITFIPQEPALFNRTLRENISYGKPGASLKEIRTAAKKAAADDFIMATDKKYDSMVGDRGIKLSGGQKQRVAIARAFLKNAPILILDEATSALDSETESVIQESFEELSRGRTTIAIAHRLSTLRHMDRIVVIDHGKIIESGPHSVLVKKKNGVYAKLWKMQTSGFIQEEPTAVKK